VGSLEEEAHTERIPIEADRVVQISHGHEDLPQGPKPEVLFAHHRLRVEDDASGLTAPRLSALSVVVFRGPLTVGELARAEQVRPPTISRLVSALQQEGLVRRSADPEDRRVRWMEATAKGKRILQEGRRRRVERLARRLRSLSIDDKRALTATADLLERLSRPPRPE